MRQTRHAPRLVLLALGTALLAACGGKAVYQRESFAVDSPFMMKVDGDASLACESARRSLLGQGYLIDSASAERVKGRKAYKSDKDLSTFIEMNIDCVPERNGSTLFANGLLSTYDLKRSNASASVGVAAVGTISLPFGQSADSLVKIAEETIDDKAFYGRFFAAVSYILKDMQPEEGEPAPATDATTAAAASSATSATSEPASVPTVIPGIAEEQGPDTTPEAGIPASTESPEAAADPAARIEAEPPAALAAAQVDAIPAADPTLSAGEASDEPAEPNVDSAPEPVTNFQQIVGNPRSGQIFSIGADYLGSLDRRRLEAGGLQANDELQRFFARNENLFGRARNYAYEVKSVSGNGAAERWRVDFHQVIDGVPVHDSAITSSADGSRAEVWLHVANPDLPELRRAAWLDRDSLLLAARGAIERAGETFDTTQVRGERFAILPLRAAGTGELSFLPVLELRYGSGSRAVRVNALTGEPLVLSGVN